MLKERIEITGSGKILQLTNFMKIEGFGFKEFGKVRSLKQDKGQRNLYKAFMDAVSGKVKPPIPFEEIMEVTKVILAIANEL